MTTLLIIAALLVWLGIEKNRHAVTVEKLAVSRARVTVLEQEQRETQYSLAAALAAQPAESEAQSQSQELYGAPMQFSTPFDAMLYGATDGRGASAVEVG